MKYTNAYFQLDMRQNGVYLLLYPPMDNGKQINVQELLNYLDSVGLKNIDPKVVDKAVKDNVNKPSEIWIDHAGMGEVGERADVRITDDRMTAIIRFYPPSTKGSYMTDKEILTELSMKKITYGISDKIIAAYLKGRQFCRDIPIAKGKPVVQGKDAKVTYHFNTSPTSAPKLNEDGSVDFHELSLFVSVKKDELLAELTPEVEGEEGMDVMGNRILPIAVKKRVLKFGKNIRLTEDKCKIYSEVDGDVKLEGDTVFVSNTYQVPADVNPSTGDINYNGNVYVAGNVNSGFRVEASGDIEVAGVVEGATLIAGGNIVLKRGIQGMGKGELIAGNDIVTKFIESSNVKAGNTVNTGSSLHSNIEAGENVIVSGRKGFLIGGTVSAGKKIEASVFGNKMNTATELKVGVKPEIMERYKDLTQSIKEKQSDMVEHKQTLDVLKKKMAEGAKLLPNQLAMAKQAGDALKVLTKELDEESEEYMKLKMEIEENKDGKIYVNTTIYPGVTLFISNRVYPVKDVRSRCQFRLSGAEVVSMPL
ncbi:MAG: FapA family protein [Lachnospiraceae bacterium]|nr:FapA family protein [Lachnospiraceae bacterium]